MYRQLIRKIYHFNESENSSEPCGYSSPSPHFRSRKNLEAVYLSLLRLYRSKDMVSEQFVREQFGSWETDNPGPFFESLPEKFTWTVAGAINPLRGLYTSKEQCLQAFGQMMSKLTAPPVCKIVNVLVSGDYAVIEMTTAEESKAGKAYDEAMCFVVRYEGDKIAEIRMYADTAVEKEIFDETS